MSQQVVCLSVPAQPLFARSIRMMAANLAVVINMDVDDVEDLRMAAEEGFVYACATKPEVCDIVFELDESGITINFTLGDDMSSDDDALQYANLLLSAICDEYDVDHASKKLRLVKVSGGAHAN